MSEPSRDRRLTDVLALLPPGAPLILRDGDRVVLAEQALEGLMRAEAYRRTDAEIRKLHVSGAVPPVLLNPEEMERLKALGYTP